MMKRVVLIMILATASLFSLAAQEMPEDAVSIWSTTALKTSFGEDGRWEAGLMQEYRHKFHEGVSQKDQWFMRPSVSYKVCSWLKLQYQFDLASTSSGFNMRFLPEITFSHKVGDFSFAYRQRLQTTWKVEAGTNSTLLRSRLKVDYSIPETPLKVNFAIEPYWCEFSKDRFSWFQRNRWYAGFDIKLTESLTFTPQYNCQAYHNHKGKYARNTYDNHIIYFTLTVKL